MKIRRYIIASVVALIVVGGIKAGFEETFNGKQGSHSWSTYKTNPETGKKESTLNITVATSASKVQENNHIIVVTSADKMPKDSSGYAPPGQAERGGGIMWLNSSTMAFRTAGHEGTHLFGAMDTTDRENPNATWQSIDSQSTQLNSKVTKRLQAYSDYPGAINNNIGPRQSTEMQKPAPSRIRKLNAADSATKPKERPRVF